MRASVLVDKSVEQHGGTSQYTQWTLYPTTWQRNTWHSCISDWLQVWRHVWSQKASKETRMLSGGRSIHRKTPLLLGSWPLCKGDNGSGLKDSIRHSLSSSRASSSATARLLPAKILPRPQLQVLSPERPSLPQSWVRSRCKRLAERPPRNCSRSGPPKASVMFAVGQVVASTDSEPSPAVAVQLQPHSRWQRASRSSEKSLSAESVPSKSIKTARSGSVALRSDRLTTAGSRLISLQGPTPPARESLQCM
jgi:hypothetical protein